MKLTSILTALLITLWALGLWLTPPEFNVRSYIHEIHYITGAVAWLWMAICLVIAARPAWIEKVFAAPIDRLYVFHKWLGFAAVVMGFVHYFAKDLLGWLVRLIWTLPKPPKVPPVADPTTWETIWSISRSVAKDSSVWLTWIMLALVLLCLTKKIPYKRWLKIHSVLAWVFILLVLHSLRLMKGSDFLSPFGFAVIVTTIVGLWASLGLLFRGPGWQKREAGLVTEISEPLSEYVSLTVKSDVASRLKPGQFVFLHLRGDEGHPFSVAEFNRETLTLWIKKAGDFTASLPERLRRGDTLTVEGPWGEFVPTFSPEPQTWCAAGIGIAPFNAWLNAAAREPHGPIALFWTVKDQAAVPFIEPVREAARKADVTLRVIDRKQPRLTAESLVENHPTTVAFCGLPKLQSILKRNPATAVITTKQEVFNWRD